MDAEISPEAVAELCASAEPPRIVDIRRPAAFRRGHIPGSDNIPFDRLPEQIETLEDADHIVTVCPHGQASIQAARLINSYEGTQSARVESMHGGLTEWDGELTAESTPDEGPEAPF